MSHQQRVASNSSSLGRLGDWFIAKLILPNYFYHNSLVYWRGTTSYVPKAYDGLRTEANQSLADMRTYLTYFMC